MRCFMTCVLLVTALSFVGCQNKKSDDQSKQDKPASSIDGAKDKKDDTESEKKSDQESKSPAAPVDRTDPASTAKAVLAAYQNKDLGELATLANSGNKGIISELTEQGEQHPRYGSIFGGDRWAAVQKWKGDVKDVRYRGKNTAAVHFVDGSGESEIFVVMLDWEGDQWCFEDINSPSKADFLELPKSRP
ncbi:MAG: hypothetical protein MI757_22905 [Pirellulales bacterium]|nr:hypothetical protein [Pirellulales bacterium]